MSRPVSWLTSARRKFDQLPPGARLDLARALGVVAEGSTPDVATPIEGAGFDVFELAVKFRGDVFRVVYAVRVGSDIWVLQVLQRPANEDAKAARIKSQFLEVQESA